MGLRALEYKKVYVSGVDNLVGKFYIPVLSESVLYKRRTGYFTSRALAMAARGLSRLIERNGKMLLLCSVELDSDDEQALRDPVRFLHDQQERVIEELDRPYDELEKKRFALLAELQARGTLEIRICLKVGGIFHEKTGVLYDEAGDYIVFTGSGNETPGGWVRNVENFSVFHSWDGSKAYADEHIAIFERQWDGNFPGIQTYPVEQAILEKIARFRDYYVEGCDEEIDLTDLEPDTGLHKRWRWTPELAFISESPRLWNSADFAYGEMGVQPFEHQDYIASKALKKWPPRYLLCDEVGLGKTIEAGLIIQGGITQGHARNILLLVPKNAMQQWQQELFTKFGLTFWRLDGNQVIGPKLHPDTEAERIPVDSVNPFTTKEQMLVSSQLVRLDERKEQVLDRHWDLIVVDEAHHARARYDPNRDSESRAPNKFLRLLRELRYRTQGLLLLTATPIQLDRRELWDLLDILELTGKWQDPDRFNAFMEAIDADPPDWGFLVSMVKDQVARDQEENDPEYRREIEYKIGQKFPGPRVNFQRLLQAIKVGDLETVYRFDDTEKEALRLLIFMHTPIRRLVFRNTRELLREYRSMDKFMGEIAERDPRKIAVELQGNEDDPTSEAGLYKRIEDYVDEYYCKYKDIRKGLGFIMVTYRKRLTSSFRAITISLTRRYEKLNRAIESGDLTDLFTDLVARDGTPMDELMEAMDEQEEEEAETLWAGISELDKNRQLSDQMRELIVQERAYLDSFIHDLEGLPGDSKFDEFRTELDSLLQMGERQVIVFSQFKDTIDYLKDSFTVSLGDRVGSYTGEGGHYWKGGKWVSCSKQDLQNKFSDSDDPLSILFCTDAASESLNLQTCSVMFNYDIPWNPMRIEQRIGRIDRIGQKAPTVKIFTYSYKGTVEDTAFDRCLERIGYFRSTLGYVQPILQLNKKIIMNSMERKDEKVEDIIDRYYQGVAEIEEETRIQHLVNQYQPEYERMLDKVPVPHAMVEQYLSPLLAGYGWTRENGTYVKEGTRITFDPGYRDRYDDTVRIVTARNASLNLLFGQLPEYPSPLEKDGIECFKLTADGYTGFAVRSGGGFKLAQRISDLAGECPGRIFPSLAAVEHHLQRMIHEKHVQGLKNWQSIWKNRYESWKTRVSMYLERIYDWFSKRETADGSVEAYDQDQLIGKWNAYLNDPDRKSTQSLAHVIRFEPHSDRSPKPNTRGRRRASPRNVYEEKTLWGEYETITHEWDKVLRLLSDMREGHAGD